MTALAVTFPTSADVLFLEASPSHVEYSIDGAMDRDSTLSREEAVRLVTPGREVMDELQRQLAPAPLYRDEHGVYFYGQITDYIKGARTGDPKNPDNHDRVVFIAFDKNRGSPSANSAVISTFHVHMILHEYDNEKDFEYKFSNRHSLMDQPFGSEAYRDVIYGLFGEGGAGPQNTADINEGIYTRYILGDIPAIEELFGQYPWEMKSPTFMLPDFAQSQGGVDDRVAGDHTDGGHIPQLEALDLLVTLARGAQYPGFPQDIAEQAGAGLRLLCSLYEFEPAFAAPQMRTRASRASYLGSRCYDAVMTTLLPGIGLDEDFVSEHLVQPYPVLVPVKYRHVLNAALDVMLEEEVFQRYLLPSNDDFTKTMWFDLIQIARPTERFPGETALHQKAQSVIARLISPVNEDGYTYHRLLWGVSDEGWSLNIFCRVGWGNPEYAKQMAQKKVRQIEELIDEDKLGEAGQLMNQLAVMTQTTEAGGHDASAMAETIKKRVESRRERYQEEVQSAAYYERPPPPYPEFLELWDRSMGGGALCGKLN